MKFKFTPDQTFSYGEYMEFVETLVSNEATSGPIQAQNLIDFTALNMKRMQRLNKRLTVSPEVEDKIGSIDKKMRWIVISEAWCGDAAQNMPILNKMASLSDHIDLQVVLRDDNLDMMDAFLTNGGRSIPKLIAVDSNDEVLFTWGPRPQKAQDMFKEHKKHPEKESPEEFKTSLHKWYTKDKSSEVQKEFLQLL